MSTTKAVMTVPAVEHSPSSAAVSTEVELPSTVDGMMDETASDDGMGKQSQQQRWQQQLRDINDYGDVKWDTTNGNDDDNEKTVKCSSPDQSFHPKTQCDVLSSGAVSSDDLCKTFAPSSTPHHTLTTYIQENSDHSITAKNGDTSTKDANVNLSQYGLPHPPLLIGIRAPTDLTIADESTSSKDRAAALAAGIAAPQPRHSQPSLMSPDSKQHHHRSGLNNGSNAHAIEYDDEEIAATTSSASSTPEAVPSPNKAQEKHHQKSTANSSSAPFAESTYVEHGVATGNELPNGGAETTTTGTVSNGNGKTHRAFFRAPGLEAPNASALLTAAASGGVTTKMRVCLQCGFTCSSKFHYNSHMNTHGTHMCKMCSYQSRTEGRLRKHMRFSHTAEQRAVAGLLDPGDSAAKETVSVAKSVNGTGSSSAAAACHLSTTAAAPNSASTAAGDASTTSVAIVARALRFGSEANEAACHTTSSTASALSPSTSTANVNGLSTTTMASLIDMMIQQRPTSTASSSTEALLRLVDSAAPTASAFNAGNGPASALEQIRALTERQHLGSGGDISTQLNEMMLNLNGGSFSTGNGVTMNNNNNNSNLLSQMELINGLKEVPDADELMNGKHESKVMDEDTLLESNKANIIGKARSNAGQSKTTQKNGGKDANPSAAATTTTVRPPQRRGGRPKKYPCKQCSYVSRDKEQSWAHAKTHIPVEKQLCCPLANCGFVTEYKHHLDYHIRNHNGSKPFSCKKCAYTCVNKSMLNSHMKSHTPNYQYSCQDCTYKTKYSHSLKMHLDKYCHKRTPGMTEYSDGEEHTPSDAEDYGNLLNDEDNGGDMLPPATGRDSANTAGSLTGATPLLPKRSSFDIGGGVSAEMDTLSNASAPSRPPTSSSSTAAAAVVTQHHPALNAMLLQQQHQQQNGGGEINGGSSNQLEQYASQMLLRQQQIDQMNELLRVANSNLYACSQCDYTTVSNDELIHHNMAHLIANQQQQQSAMTQQQQQQSSFASLYQNLAAAQQSQDSGSNSAAVTAATLLQQHHHHHQQQQQQQQHQHNVSINGSSASVSTSNNHASSTTIASVLQAPDLLTNILTPDHPELALQLHQELLRVQAAAQLKENESRLAVVAAMTSGSGSASSANALSRNGSTANGSLSNGNPEALTLNTASGNLLPAVSTSLHHGVTSFSHHQHHHRHHTMNSNVCAATSHSNTSSSNGGYGTTVGGEDAEQLLMMHESLSPAASSGRRGSMESTSGGECSSSSKTCCSVSPGSVHDGLGGGLSAGSRKRKQSKTLKVDMLSSKLRQSTDGGGDEKRSKLLAAELDKIKQLDSENSDGTTSISNLLAQLKHFQELHQRQGATATANGATATQTMPHVCHHCRIGFADRALYQIHLGFHGYETPFKCNRCGHRADSSIEFNIHLMEGEHRC